MSHSVTITRTTTSTSTSAVVVNSGYLKTIPGLLKLGQLLLGPICVGIVGYYISHYNYANQVPELFFLLMATTFLIGTFCLLTACLISLSTSTIISKTIYEVVYHLVATVLYFAGALTLLVDISNRRRGHDYEAYMAASVIGLIISALYLFSTILAIKTYRGL